MHKSPRRGFDFQLQNGLEKELNAFIKQTNTTRGPEKYCTRAREIVATALLLSPLPPPPLVVFALCLLTYAYLWHLELWVVLDVVDDLFIY